MNAIYKFVMSMLAKRGGKTGIATIQSGKGLNVELSVEQIHKTLTNMGVDVSKITSPKEVEKFLNIQQSWLKQQTKGPTIGGHPVIDASSSEGQGITRDLFNMSDRLSGKNVIKTDFGGGITDIVTETITKIKVMKPIDGMKEANSVLARKGKYKNLTEEQSQKIIKDTEDHIFERNVDVDPEDFAHGGRTGSGLNYLLGEDDQNVRVPFAMGKRAFLKWIGSGVAGIGAAKTGLLGLLKGGGKKEVIEEVVKQSAGSGAPPAYFFNLVKKIKNLGDDAVATQDKAVAKTYKDYTLQEDFAGNIEIMKKGGDDMFPEDVFMSYKVDNVPLKKGKKKSTKVEEYEEYTATPDRDGKMKDIETGVPDSVVEEGTVFEDTISEFTKKASGGRASLSAGGLAGLLGE